MENILNVLPPRFKPELEPFLKNQSLEEIRFRNGVHIHTLLNERETTLQNHITKPEDLDYILNRACEYSLHAVHGQITQGYLTMSGGNRMGLCGTVVMEQGKVKAIRRLSSISIRIAHECKGISRNIVGKLQNSDGTLANTLIISPPGKGKTTLLRDIIRAISSGEGIPPHRISLVDERSEIAALHQGTPTFDLGSRTDILEGIPKAHGLLFLLRSMNPQVLAVDEITATEDINALTHVTGCGVKLLASTHANDKNDLFTRPIYEKMMNLKLFQKLILIKPSTTGRQYFVEELQ